MSKKNSKTFHLVSLGCAKNTVDSDSMAQFLESAGFQAVTDPKKPVFCWSTLAVS